KRGANTGKKAVDDWLLETFGEIPAAGDPRLRQLTAHQKAERASRRHKAETEVSGFNFPKLHLCGHFGSTVRLFGNLLNWLTEITESLYKLLKSYNSADNRGGNFLEQIVIRWT